MVSTSGSTLLPQSAANAFITQLFPRTTLLTPNLPEALLLAKLSGYDFGKLENLTHEKRIELASVLARKVQWILLKGGHLAVEKNGKKVVVDILANSTGRLKEFISDFSSSTNTHGTGCSLACTASYESSDDSRNCFKSSFGI